MYRSQIKKLEKVFSIVLFLIATVTFSLAIPVVFADDLATVGDVLHPISVSAFHAHFSNSDYSYDIDLKHGSYVMNVWKTPGGDASIDTHLFWQPPWPMTTIDLKQAKEGRNGYYFEFEVGKPWEISTSGSNQAEMRKQLQRSYILFIPHDRHVRGAAYRIEKDLQDQSILENPTDRFSTAHRLHVGDVTEFEIKKQNVIAPISPLVADHPMPLLDISINAKDLEVLYSLKDVMEIGTMKKQLQKYFPELILETLPADHPNEGLYTPAFSDPNNPRPVIGLNVNATRDALFHETLHYLIDRARLKKWHAETVDQKRSYRAWQMAHSHEIENWMMKTRKNKDVEAMNMTTAEMTDSMRKGIAREHGEEVEICFFLLQHREEFGLSEADLSGQTGYMIDHFGQLTEKLIPISELLHDLPVPTLSHRQGRLLEINDQLAQFLHRLTEIAAYVFPRDCSAPLTPPGPSGQPPGM